MSPRWLDILRWLGKSIPWQIMVGIFVATGVLLFFSVSLGIYEWAHPYRGLEITGFAFSGAVLLAHIGSAVGPSILRHTREAAVRRRGRNYLHSLNPAEKKHCKYFVDNDGSPLPHNPANGAIASLVLKGILWQPEHGWDWMYEFNIQPWALEYLKKHPELLQGS
jgi:Super-infection exclusion protein B